MKKLAFVIQKHQTVRPHFDFRLEINGKMPSWAIPRGFQDNPKEKRLAMKTEDHPLDYKNFEGTIPEGEYGAGEVEIFDEGTYIPEIEISKGVREEVKGDDGEKVMEDGIKKGEIKFYLKGKKYKGSFALVKTKGFPPGRSENAWLLIKHKDEE